MVCSWKARDMVHKSILRILIVELTRYIHEKFNQSIHVFQKVFPVCPLKQVWCLVRTNILTLGAFPLSTLASSHLSQEEEGIKIEKPSEMNREFLFVPSQIKLDAIGTTLLGR